MKAAGPAIIAAEGLQTRLLTFKELATLMEAAPEGAWRKISKTTLPVSPDARQVRSAQIKKFIELNAKLFGPGNNEL